MERIFIVENNPGCKAVIEASLNDIETDIYRALDEAPVGAEVRVRVSVEPTVYVPPTPMDEDAAL